MRLSSETPARALRFVVVSTAVGVVLAACGGDGKATVQGAAASVHVAPAAPAAAAANAASLTPVPAKRAAPTRQAARPSTRPYRHHPAARPRHGSHRSAQSHRPPAASRRTTPPTTPPSGRTTTPPTTAVAAGGMSADEAQVLRLVNRERVSAGCGALGSSAVLLSVARAHSKDMAVHAYFDHNSQNGRTPFDRMRAAGYRGNLMGENIAAGQPTPAAVMDAWMHSPGHRANILNCGYKVIGIGVVRLASSPFRVYWTQDFGDR